MIEKRIDKSFQNLFEKYGYSNSNTSKKSLFEQLDDCDRVNKVLAKNLNEALSENMRDENNNFWYTHEAPEQIKELVKRANAGIDADKKKCVPALNKIAALLDPHASNVDQLVDAYEKADNATKTKVTWLLSNAMTWNDYATANYKKQGYNIPQVEALEEEQEIQESMFGGKALSKEELCKKWGCNEDELDGLNSANEA